MNPIIRSIGHASARLLATGLLTMAAMTPASAHIESYYYEAMARNTYVDGTGNRKDGAGDTPQSVSVVGAWAYADTTFGGTVYAGAEVHPIDPFDLNYQTSAVARGFLSYNVWIDGPDPDALVPVRFWGAGSISANSNQALGEIILRFGSIDDRMILQQWNARGSLTGDMVDGIFQVVAGFTADQVFYMQPSKTYYVEMLAGASVTASPNNAHAQATVDPVFTILGDYARSYRVMGVPGGATGAVPEPASWALMIAGFAAVGSMMRRRQLRPAAVGI